MNRGGSPSPRMRWQCVESTPARMKSGFSGDSALLLVGQEKQSRSIIGGQRPRG
jgi:hypothetical protein